MIDDSKLTFREKQLIRELTLTIAEVNSNDAEVKEVIFRGLASYVEGIKVGIKFPTHVNSQKLTMKSFY